MKTRAIAGIVWALFCASMALASSTNQEIKHSEKRLDQTMKKQQEVTRQLDKIAEDIQHAKRENIALNAKLNQLSKVYIETKETYLNLQNELSGYDKRLKAIDRKLRIREERFNRLLAEQSSIIYAMSQTHEPTPSLIIQEEVHVLVRAQNAKDIKRLRQEIEEARLEKSRLDRLYSQAKGKIASISKQRSRYQEKLSIKKRLLGRLADNEKAYRKTLQETMDQQNDLRATLAKLNILHRQEVEQERLRVAEQKAAMEAQRKREEARRRERILARNKARKEGAPVVYETQLEEDTSDRTVRKIDSSYQRDKLYPYRGKKTISPIRGAKVVKGFGTYIDPIYKIKIFNDSITLRAPNNDAMVRNVLHGEVVFSDETPTLGKVVIVKHNNQMHTIYAGLSKIAPNIKQGIKIKKGYVIGRVAHTLIFEATKNSRHINPVRLINL
jgi:murein DD-endopeptidase MepM/ murein hydrolase activator NlpD